MARDVQAAGYPNVVVLLDVVEKALQCRDAAWAAEQAARAGVRIALEPINHRDMPGFLLNTVAQGAAVVEALQTLGLPDARPNPGYAGVYVDPREVNGKTYDQKICSIGVAIKQNVALHGIGLNVCPDLHHFDLIVPCGLQDTQMTSVQREYELRGIERQVTMPEAKKALADAFARVFAGYDWSLPGMECEKETLRVTPPPLRGTSP